MKEVTMRYLDLELKRLVKSLDKIITDGGVIFGKRSDLIYWLRVFKTEWLEYMVATLTIDSETSDQLVTAIKELLATY